MNINRTIAGGAVAVLLCASSMPAQTDTNPAETKPILVHPSEVHPAETNPAKPAAEMVETFYLASTFQTSDALELRVAMQNVLTPGTSITYNSFQNALIVRTTPDQMPIARKVVADLDRPKKTYRLSFTITESDSGKQIGTQHFAFVLASGQRTSLKQGSKVPVATGSYTAGNSSTQTQFTYLDVGINLDASIDDSSNGLRLKSKVEQSSIADSTVIADVREPIIRQSVLEGISLLTLGKPLVLGSLDIPGSTRHLDIDTMVEIVK